MLETRLAACLQAQCAGLQLDDRSKYTVLPPRVWGLIPRLAAQMRMEKVNAISSWEAGQGFMLSLELLDCEATGFQNEPGNFICRSAAPRSMSGLHMRPSSQFMACTSQTIRHPGLRSCQFSVLCVLMAQNALMKRELVCADVAWSHTALLLHRYRRAPPVARVTYAETPELRQTAITLQDGCFGAGSLMRIAAMFVRPDSADAVQDESAVEFQAAPGAAAADAISVPEPPTLSVPEASQPDRYTIATYPEQEEAALSIEPFLCCPPHSLSRDAMVRLKHEMQCYPKTLLVKRESQWWSPKAMVYRKCHAGGQCSSRCVWHLKLPLTLVVFWQESSSQCG